MTSNSLVEYSIEKLCENYPVRKDPLLLSGPYVPVSVIRSEIERLTAEVARLKGVCQLKHDNREATLKDNDRLRAALERMRAWLHQHAIHTPDCAMAQNLANPCTCGWLELVKVET